MSTNITHTAIAERVKFGRGFFSRTAEVPKGRGRIRAIAAELSRDGIASFPGSHEPALSHLGYEQLSSAEVAAIAPLACIQRELRNTEHLVCLAWADGTLVLLSMPSADEALPTWWCELAYGVTHSMANEIGEALV